MTARGTSFTVGSLVAMGDGGEREHVAIAQLVQWGIPHIYRAYCDEHALRGVPGSWRVYRVEVTHL